MKNDLENVFLRLSNSKRLRFPGSQPITFQQEHLEKLKKEEYYVCEKSDGRRYFLMYAFNCCYLINSKLEFFFLTVSSAEMNNSLFDGELIEDDSKEINFYGFDTFSIQNHSMANQSLQTRLKMILLAIPYCPTPFISNIKLKKMYLPSACKYLLEQEIPNLPHKSDGLVFTSLYTAEILKWKPPELNSVDFVVKALSLPLTKTFQEEQPKYIHLYWQDKGKLSRFNNECIYLTPEEQIQFQELKIDQVICECWFDPNWFGVEVKSTWEELVLKPGGGWRFMRFRPDKLLPNSIGTVNSILKSIQYPVKREELYTTLQ